VKVLVTGGAGYIGSVVVRELIRAGHSVMVVDNLSRGHRQALPAEVELCVCDVGDRAALEGVFRVQSVDAVMHFAALIEVGESMKVPERYFTNNTANTLTLLEMMLQHGVNRFVFSSTAALYGNPDRTPIEETDRLQPTSVYGESKRLVECALEWFRKTRELRYASLRYFNAAGAAGPDFGEDHQPESHLIPLILSVALGQRDSIAIYGADYATPDGTCVRDYVHVSDLASAHLLALTALSQSDRLIYNLGNGLGFSVRQVIDVARRVTGHPIPAMESPRRTGDPAILVASSAKIRRELDWKPRFPDMEKIIGSAWEWHREHPQGYQA